MDKVHDPDNRPWISELLKPKDILDKYQERVALHKANEGVCEESLRPHHLQSMIGVDDETFKDLEAAMSEDNLTTPGEMDPCQAVTPNWNGGVYGHQIPKIKLKPIPEEGRLALKTLYIQADFLKKSKEKNSKLAVNRRRELMASNDHFFMSQPMKQKYLPGFSDRQHLYTVRVYRPLIHPNVAVIEMLQREIIQSQEIWLLGNNTLDQLRDMITCPVDNNYVGEQQVDTVEKQAPRAGDVYTSGFIYIGDCFYIDTRKEGNIDYSDVIIEWAKRSNRGIGPFRKGVMQETKMDDLELRIGCPYVFTHQGNHEHLLVVTDVRLVGPEEPQGESKYPMVRCIGQSQSRMCMVCEIKIATWVTLNNVRVAENPFFWCTLCYKSFNLTRDGGKEGEFQEFRYHDVNSV